MSEAWASLHQDPDVSADYGLVNRVIVQDGPEDPGSGYQPDPILCRLNSITDLRIIGHRPEILALARIVYADPDLWQPPLTGLFAPTLRAGEAGALAEARRRRVGDDRGAVDRPSAWVWQ